MRSILLLIFFATPLVASPQGLLDGFVQKKGTADLALSASYQRAGTYYAGSDPINYSREQIIGTFFGSYGITRKADIIVNIPFINNTALKGNGKFQDGSLLLTYEPFGTKIEEVGYLNFILGAGGRHPLSDYITESGQAIGQQAKSILGRGVLQLDLQNPLFFNIRGGYDHNLDPVPSTYVYGAKAGWAFSGFYMDVFFESQRAIGGKDYRGTGNKKPDSFRELGVGSRKSGITLFKPLGKGWGISVTGSYILTGRNISQNLTGALGLIYRLRPDG